MKFYEGGHGKALEQTNRLTIAAWLLQDIGVDYDHTQAAALLKQEKVLVGKPNWLWGMASRTAPGLFVIVLVFMVYLLIIGQRPVLALSELLVLMWFLNII
jgi:hypothetical protein